MSKNTTHQNSFYNSRKEFKVNNTDQQDQMRGWGKYRTKT